MDKIDRVREGETTIARAGLESKFKDGGGASFPGWSAHTAGE